jgi:hypothetical protein
MLGPLSAYSSTSRLRSVPLFSGCPWPPDSAAPVLQPHAFGGRHVG